MDRAEKLAILAQAAKYDASCSTSGSGRKNTPGGIGNGAVGGICHSWSADGRCIALLKVLLSNACVWDCAYCANRRSADHRRAAFEPEELVRLIMDFYKRNYIEGVLLSSAVISTPDATMERLLGVARTLRTRERFNGYIHLKAIPGAAETLVNEAARFADRVSVNIEMPSAASLARVAPDKTAASIFGPMRVLARASGFEPRRLAAPAGEGAIEGGALPAPKKPCETWLPVRRGAAEVAEPAPLFEAGNRLSSPSSPGRPPRPSVREARKTRARNPEAAVLPAGQTTQLVVGASPESDAEILLLAENLYLAYDVRRVYYSAFIPVSPDPRVPALAGPPLLREHRLYQADWLFRFYGFAASEIFEGGSPSLDEDLDPKSAWALRNLGYFPLDVNLAAYGELLRVPGVGPVSASRILRARRSSRLREEDLAALGVVMKRARWFLRLAGEGSLRSGISPSSRSLDDAALLRSLLADPAGPRGRVSSQLELDFGAAP
jgi:putative DNA modification/repair radical SAM protein